ncbi:HNH endonuclease [Agrobacterium tumefaciens]|uniref:HNH endonuclease n=1 Tax=Agrobacterium tumefaciens TaxID=358 RepID=UPI001560FBF3|nr:HNH endonuclease [Agrobacterium tumefaciens]
MDALKLTQDRIRANINVNAQGCWEWQLYIRRNGYGQMKHEGKTVDAHRVSYRCFHGEIPDGLFVCHRCDNKRCCNPDHLFLGTHSENMIDHRKKGGRLGPKRKMTPEMVAKANELRSAGVIYKDIAQRLGVSTMSIWMHLNAPANDNNPSESASYIPRSKRVP